MRCDWVQSDISKTYHDLEWGLPQHDDKKLFEMLILEGMQAGLSWDTILKRREGMRKAFDNFDYNIIAKYDENKCKELLNNPNVIRNRLKIASLPINATAFLRIREVYETFDKYIWQFVNYEPIIHKCKSAGDMPIEDEHSKRMSRSLKQNGFKFVGSTICYAFMQAVGMVDDHTVWCDWHSTRRKGIN